MSRQSTKSVDSRIAWEHKSARGLIGGMEMATVAMGVDRHCSSKRMRIWIPIGLVALSFFIYAYAVLIVSRDQQNDFIPERSSIAAAVSNVAYGAPLGKVYSGVLAQLLDFKVPLD